MCFKCPTICHICAQNALLSYIYTLYLQRSYPNLVLFMYRLIVICFLLRIIAECLENTESQHQPNRIFVCEHATRLDLGLSSRIDLGTWPDRSEPEQAGHSSTQPLLFTHPKPLCYVSLHWDSAFSAFWIFLGLAWTAEWTWNWGSLKSPGTLQHWRVLGGKKVITGMKHVFIILR